ncbi:MAG: hypothetical protein R2787_05965 [Saprospiraceae bacterium]
MYPVSVLPSPFLAGPAAIPQGGDRLSGHLGVFYLVDSLHDFQVFTDEDGLETFLGHLPNADYASLRNFISSEMIFFGTGSIIALAILAIRMIISVWRWHNLKKA